MVRSTTKRPTREAFGLPSVLSLRQSVWIPIERDSSIGAPALERFILRILQNAIPYGWAWLTALVLGAIVWPAPALVRSLVDSGPPSESQAGPQNPAAASERAKPAELVYLPAGSRFDERHPPAGWSDLVLRSTPKLAAGDLDTLSESSLEMARRIRLTIAANVLKGPNGVGHRLERVGIGLSTPAKGEGDVIVTAGDVEGSKNSWSVSDRIVLAAAEFELSRADLVAASPTLAIMRMPTTTVVDGLHKKARLMYALLVAPDTGRLRTFHWWETDGPPAQSFTEFQHPDIFESPLHVKAKWLAGFPVAWSFAMIHAPKGVERTVPPELARLIAPEAIDSSNPGALEAALIDAASPPSTTKTTP